MINNSGQKINFASNLNAIATRRAADKIAELGHALPCRVNAVRGSLVQVAFEVESGVFTLPMVWMPKAESQWFRGATQINDTGMTVPADVFLGGVSGLGSGLASLTPRHNLTDLAFLPLGKKAYPAAPDANKAWVNGPAGATLSTTDLASMVTVSEAGVVITVGGKTWSFTAAGLTMSTGIVAETHQHISAASGSPTGVPIA